MTVSLVLVPLMLGTVDLGEALAQTSRLDHAFDAALYHIWANPGGFTVSSIQQAAQAAYGSAAPALTITTAAACACVSSSYIKGVAVTCTATCPTGQALAAYQTVTAAVQFPLPAAFPGVLTSPMSLSVQGTVRTR